VPATCQGPPTKPPPSRPTWPFRFSSTGIKGVFTDGTGGYNGTWIYDWPLNRWRQDTCLFGPIFGPNAICGISLWIGNEGNIYNFSPDLKNCTIKPAPVPSVTHPDSFATQGEYSKRELVGTAWSDTWVVNTASWIGYNFTLAADINTGYLSRDCGPTSPNPPYENACTYHPNVTVGYSAAAWEAFFKLPLERCVKEARPTLRAAAPHPGIILMPSLFS